MDVQATASATLTDENMTYNTSNGQGGAVHNNGTMSVIAGYYAHNTSTSGGGAICSTGALTLTSDKSYDYPGIFESNVAVNGGAIFSQTQSGSATYKFTSTGIQYTGNKAIDSGATISSNKNAGGAIYINNNTKNNTLKDNKYKSNSAYYGGAVHVAADATCTSSGETFVENSVNGGGGAFHSNGTSTITLGTFKKNMSSVGGGAIESAGITNISNSKLEENTADEGGAIHVCQVIDGTTITSKLTSTANDYISNAARKGGAIEVDTKSTVDSFNDNIQGCSATQIGGAFMSIATLSIYGGTIGNETANTAGEKGGAVYHEGKVFNMSNDASIDKSNDVYLTPGKYITVPGILNKNFVARITPSDYTPGRTVVKNTYGVKGSTIEPKFTLTPKTGFFLKGGDTYSVTDNADVVISRNYPVTYDCGTSPNPTGHFSDGTNLDDEDVKEWGVDYELRTDKPTAKGYLFSGWNTEEDGSGDDYFPGDTYSENEALYLYAQWTPIKYTVAYNGNGSTSGSMLTQTFTYGKSYNLAANGFVRSNYHFAGWNTKADGSGTSYSDKQSVKNLATKNGVKVTLYAQWAKNTYTIRFHANGGAGSMADVTVPYDTSYKLPTNKFTYQGYAFDKWKTEDGASIYGNEATIKYSSAQLKNGVLDLYAQWKINQYTLTITGDSGVEKITGSGTYNYGTTANVTYQIKPGYHIKNITGTTADGDPNGAWTGHTGKGGTVTDTWTMKACNRTIVVHTEPNTYTVKYDGNGNTGGSTASSSHTYDTAKALTANGFTKTGYTFKGWNTKADGSGTAYADKASVKNLTTTNGGTVTLYAQWTANQYQLTLNPNNGAFSDGATTAKTISPNLIYNGTNWWDISSQKVSRTGYTFDGWYDKASGGEKVYDTNGSCVTGTYWKNGKYQHTGNLTVYAQWKANTYTVTIHPNGGKLTVSDSSIKSNTDGTATLTVTYGYTNYYGLGVTAGRTGYQMLGFFDGASNGTKLWNNGGACLKDGKYWNASNQWVYAGNVDVYAQWQINRYTLTITGDSGVESITGNGTYDYGTTVKATYKIKPGYHIRNTSGTPMNGGTDETWTNLEGKEGTLTDNWQIQTCNRNISVHTEPNTYTVKYDGNGSTGGSTASSSHTYDAAKALTANGYTRTGYSFNGWNTKADGSGTAYADKASVKNLTTTNGGTVTLYAQWTKNSYYLDLNGWLDGKSTGNITGYGTADIYIDGVQKANDVTDFYQKIPYGSKYEIKDIKTVTGHTYVGVHSGSITGTIGTSNVGVVLEFKTNKYTVTFDKNNGTGTMADQTFTYGVKQALTKNAFTRTGYTFAGWNTQTDGKGTTYADQQEVTSLSAADGATVRLYAQWTANQYQLTLNPNNGSFSDGTTAAKTLSPNLIYNGTNWWNISAQTVSRTGYTFDGWYDKMSGGEKVYDVNGSCVTGTYWKNSKYQHTGNLTIYAHWRANKLTVNYYPNGATKVDNSAAMDGSGVSTITPDAQYRYDDFNYDATMPSYGLWDAQRFIRTGYTSTNKYHLGSKDGTVLLDAGNNVFAKTQDLATAAGVLSDLEKGDVSISIYADWKANTYTIKYNGNGNTGGSTAGSSHTYDTAKGLTANGFTKTGYTFKNWNTKADGSGTSYADKASVKNLTATAGGTVNLYAQWTANKYTVAYNANGGTGTMANQELTYDKAATLNTNTFKRTGYRFNGWNTKADGTGTSYADKASVKNLTANSGGTVTLYAKWYSAAPELEAKDTTYYEGQDITKAMLLKNVTKASDAEDGDMTGKVIITKIEYSAGKLVDGKPQAAYTKSWTNGMPDSEKLDTWFQQLPKEKAPVTHKITYQVTDLSGKTTTKTSTITVKYNEFPVIKAEDRYFTLEEAKSGKITKDVLLKEAIASGKLKAEDKEDGVISNKVTILDYKDTDFKNVNGNATVTVIFKVNDSMGPSGVGKETVCEVKVKIIDSGSDYWRDDDGTARKQVRFITQKYYDKNKDTDFHGMTSEEIEASSDNGGLNVMSKWYQNAAYKALLTGSFAKDAGTDYKISAEKAKELKQKIESNGIGNSKSSNALTDIYNSLK